MAATPQTELPQGAFVTFEDEECYRIANVHRLPPFLMSIASASDLWLFLTSRGGLAAGRRNADGSLFPYETEDKLYDAHLHTGPVTIVRDAAKGSTTPDWYPFFDGGVRPFRTTQNLYKSPTGDRVWLEEINHDLDFVFRCRWAASDEHGWVRAATLENLGRSPRHVMLLDGVRNVLPFGAPLATYQKSSTLVDAYKLVDLDPQSDLAVYSLTSEILDRPEPAEVLRANVVWRCGLPNARVALSIEALESFRSDGSWPSETRLTGRRGNYLALSEETIAGSGRLQWYLVADAGRTQVEVTRIRKGLREEDRVADSIETAVDASHENLMRILGSTDGLQRSGSPMADAHHCSNALYNSMRGGVFLDGYAIPAEDFRAFVEIRNRKLAEERAESVQHLSECGTVNALLRRAEESGDADLERLCHEYLPMFFSRRHGDPSRPWNQFTIDLRTETGSLSLRYQGNWRDIFQNWEALLFGYPEFLPSVIAKFVNASTVDGFNPYRVTQDGIDWEIPDPDDPWSHIGYWGDHQILYLYRLLEWLPRFAPGRLESILPRAIYSFADVPYRIRPHEALRENPHETIEFDREKHARIEDRVSSLGTDGKLALDGDGRVVHVNLVEKLLVPALSKISCYVPDAGIWMNTQRPEWNDANNALVGHGVSVVTLCYLVQYLRFLEKLLERGPNDFYPLSTEVAVWLREIRAAVDASPAGASGRESTPAERGALLDALGETFSRYREAVYGAGFSGTVEVPSVELRAFCRAAVALLEPAVAKNRRTDGLYHSYNVMHSTRGSREVEIWRLGPMLEGQVAVLASDVAPHNETPESLDALFESELYRRDGNRFLLYPERELDGFLEKNRVPGDRISGIELLSRLLEEGDEALLVLDADGGYRFRPEFRNARSLEAALDRLGERAGLEELVRRDRGMVLDLYETVFEHHAFTGRSGTMYGYEGIGCTYWHMVSKLLLAVQDRLRDVRQRDPHGRAARSLSARYFRIRGTLGFEKSPSEYGAFPMDPYSHTPSHSGARQPGMTGQVKEGLLIRFGELGARIEGGTIRFDPFLLREMDFTTEPERFRYFDVRGVSRGIDLPPGSLAFTYAQVPIIYHVGEGPLGGEIRLADGKVSAWDGAELTPEWSRSLFERADRIQRIDVQLPRGTIANE